MKASRAYGLDLICRIIKESFKLLVVIVNSSINVKVFWSSSTVRFLTAMFDSYCTIFVTVKSKTQTNKLPRILIAAMRQIALGYDWEVNILCFARK